VASGRLTQKPPSLARKGRQCEGGKLTKNMDLADFRAVRRVLEPDDFALTDGKPDPPPTDLIDRESWEHIMIFAGPRGDHNHQLPRLADITHERPVFGMGLLDASKWDHRSGNGRDFGQSHILNLQYRPRALEDGANSTARRARDECLRGAMFAGSRSSEVGTLERWR
jgi:hypothetical protein